MSIDETCVVCKENIEDCVVYITPCARRAHLLCVKSPDELAKECQRSLKSDETCDSETLESSVCCKCGCADQCQGCVCATTEDGCSDCTSACTCSQNTCCKEDTGLETAVSQCCIQPSQSTDLVHETCNNVTVQWNGLEIECLELVGTNGQREKINDCRLS
jgi:hypothetical protein